MKQKNPLDLNDTHFLSSIAQQVSDSIIVTDLNFRIIYVNKAFEKLFGYSKKEVIGKLPDMLNAEPLADSIQKYIYKVVSVGHTWKGSLKNKRKDGKLFICELNVSPMYNKKGEIYAYIGLQRDITESIKAEKALKNSKKLIEKEVKLKTKELKKAQEEIKHYAEKLHLKIKRIDEKRIPLTNKEKLAFYGLVAYPHLTTNRVAKKIGMHTATVNSIKNRLKREGYYQTAYIPRFDLIGCKLLTVNARVGDIKATGKYTLAIEWKKDMFKKILAIPEEVFFLTTNKECFCINISEDWATYKAIEDSFEAEFQKRGLKFEINKTTHFSPIQSTLNQYFNFATILKKRFELTINKEKEANVQFKKRGLSKNEKILVYGLVKYPELTVHKLAQKIKLSMPTICKLRKRLLQEGIIKNANIPDFRKAGFELLVVTFGKHTGDINTDLCKNPNVIFSITSKTDHATIALYKDFSEAKKGMESCLLCLDNREKDPKQIIIPLDHVEFSRFEFAPLIRKLFNIRKIS
jgi:PAS domain S-box-containing protein